MTSKENKLDQASSELDEAINEQAAEVSDESIVEELLSGDLSIEQLQEQLIAADTKVAEYWDQVVRSKAEMENIKRRARLDVENARKFSVERFAQAILPVVDSLEQGLETSQNVTDVKVLREGMKMTCEMLISALERQGLKQIMAVGEKFNPELHEAMSMVESAEVPEDHVITVFQKGFQLNGRLARPARVVVSRGTADVKSIDEQA
ncbi:MAG: nucleotide exchange factor GrpE [Gammaproteobacteria bacterium]|nr:MAG: nucleotide exchange factor GrpE [Gammaproteobacteria bacterium]